VEEICDGVNPACFADFFHRRARSAGEHGQCGTVYYHACDGAGDCRFDTTKAASQTVQAAACTVFDTSCNPVTVQLGSYCHYTAEWMGTFCRLHWYGCAGDGTCDQSTPCSYHDTTSVSEADCH
jgi:hypothetical protein